MEPLRDIAVGLAVFAFGLIVISALGSSWKEARAEFDRVPAIAAWLVLWAVIVGAAWLLGGRILG